MNISVFANKANELHTELDVIKNKALSILKDLVGSLGGRVELKENNYEGKSPILSYFEDLDSEEYYEFANTLLIDSKGELILETSDSVDKAEKRDINEILFLIDYVVTQVEHPEYFENDEEE